MTPRTVRPCLWDTRQKRGVGRLGTEVSWPNFMACGVRMVRLECHGALEIRD